MDNFLYDDNWTNYTHKHIYMYVYLCGGLQVPLLAATSRSLSPTPSPFVTLFKYFFVCTHFHSSFRAVSLWLYMLAWNSCISHINIARECVFVHGFPIEFHLLDFFFVLWLYAFIILNTFFVTFIFFHISSTYLRRWDFQVALFTYNLPTAIRHNSHTNTTNTYYRVHVNTLEFSLHASFGKWQLHSISLMSYTHNPSTYTHTYTFNHMDRHSYMHKRKLPMRTHL